jgi:predicted CopG family antitoxin
VAVKTITIDLEAYDLLAARKQKGESFSRVLKRLLSEGDSTAAGLLRDLPRIALEEETLEQIDDIIRERGNDWTDDPPQSGRAR